MFEQSHLIWMGDLNYRISLDEQETKCLISECKIDALLKYDQVLVNL
jgi:hypothetical protein